MEIFLNSSSHADQTDQSHNLFWLAYEVGIFPFYGDKSYVPEIQFASCIFVSGSPHEDEATVTDWTDTDPSSLSSFKGQLVYLFEVNFSNLPKNIGIISHAMQRFSLLYVLIFTVFLT